MKITDEQFVSEINSAGYCVIENALPSEFVTRAREALERAIELEAAYHRSDAHADYGMVMICALYGAPFTELFDIPDVVRGFDLILGEGSIVYAYTSSSMPPGRSNYSLRIHVDCPRLIPGYRTNMGAIFLLDDFTEENGGTWFLPGSQYRVDAPTEEEFFAGAKRLIAPAGSICFLDPRLWHSGAKNQTDRWRHAVTLNMCRPWMKQRLDIPRAMAGMDLSGMSAVALQKLGFLAQVPANYDEYYLPPDQRKFRQRNE